MRGLIAVIAASLTLSGCAVFGNPNEFIETNRMILQSNEESKQALAVSLSVCKGEPGCLVGVSMAYASRMGERDLVQPERTSEILKNVVPFASLGLQAFDMFYGGVGGSGTSQGYVVTGDNNTFSGIGNSMEASGSGNSVESPFSSSNSFSWSTNNRDYALGTDTGTITDLGVVDVLPTDTTIDTATAE